MHLVNTKNDAPTARATRKYVFGMEQVVLSEKDFRRAAGYRLRLAISASGIKLVQAANIMDMTKNHLGNWLRGDGPIDSYKLYRLCRVTHITADYVLLDDPSGLPQPLLDRLFQAARELESVGSGA